MFLSISKKIGDLTFGITLVIKYILYRSCVDLNEHYIILIHTTRMTHLKKNTRLYSEKIKKIVYQKHLTVELIF
jgi:hypothetical protein